MKTNPFSLLLVCLSLFMLTETFAQKQADIKAKLEKIAAEMSEKMVKGDLHHDYYADDAISMPEGQPMIEGIDALKANADQMEASGINFTEFELKPSKVMVNGKMVTEIGNYSLVVTMPEVPEPIADKGKYLTIWEIQKDGKLKIKVETWNTDMSPMGPQ